MSNGRTCCMRFKASDCKLTGELPSERAFSTATYIGLAALERACRVLCAFGSDASSALSRGTAAGQWRRAPAGGDRVLSEPVLPAFGLRGTPRSANGASACSFTGGDTSQGTRPAGESRRRMTVQCTAMICSSGKEISLRASHRRGQHRERTCGSSSNQGDEGGMLGAFSRRAEKLRAPRCWDKRARRFFGGGAFGWRSYLLQVKLKIDLHNRDGGNEGSAGM